MGVSTMTVTHVSLADGPGGAARAAYRIHRALLAVGVHSRMRVVWNHGDDPTVIGGGLRRYPLQRKLSSTLRRLRRRGFRTENPVVHSIAWLGAGLGQELERSDADLVHLHWLGDQTLSIEEAGRLRQPVVWTLHDMWPFCGAEHYAWDERWREGYGIANRPAHESGFDLNRWVWQRKRAAWRQPMHIVATSGWLADCVSRSKLMAGWPVEAIPYPLDLGAWRPVEPTLARQQLGLRLDSPVIAFGAMGGGEDPSSSASFGRPTRNAGSFP
jgi:hypothetical protein